MRGPIALSWRRGAAPNVWLYYAPLVLRACFPVFRLRPLVMDATREPDGWERTGDHPAGTQQPLIYLSNDPAVLSLWPCVLPLSTVVANTSVHLIDELEPSHDSLNY